MVASFWLLSGNWLVPVFIFPSGLLWGGPVYDKLLRGGIKEDAMQLQEHFLSG